MPASDLALAPKTLQEKMFCDMMACWRSQQLDELFEFIHPHAIHEINFDSSTLPQLASAQGKAEMRGRFDYIVEIFEFTAWDIRSLQTVGNEVQSTIAFTYRHRETGETISSRVRLFAKWRDGRFIDFQEHVDEAFIVAFMKMVGEI